MKSIIDKYEIRLIRICINPIFYHIKRTGLLKVKKVFYIHNIIALNLGIGTFSKFFKLDPQSHLSTIGEYIFWAGDKTPTIAFQRQPTDIHNKNERAIKHFCSLLNTINCCTSTTTIVDFCLVCLQLIFFVLSIELYRK